MKRHIISLAVATLCLASCELDRQPETVLVDSNFWKSETDFRGACNRLYVDLNGFGQDYRADDIITSSPNSVSSGNWTVPGTAGDWTNPYTKIATCNNIVSKITASTADENKKARWIAEARFFRAYHYFDLVRKYGDVPLILSVFTSTSDPDIKMPRTSREEVIKQCYEDLDYAYQNLPDIDKLTSETDWGRVSKSAALALTTRIGLYEGTYSKYHNLGSDYKAHLQHAVTAAETLIKSGKHNLYPDYAKMFLFDGEGRQNKENILVKIYGPNESGSITHNNSRTLENAASVTRQAVEQYLYVDGLPREKSPLAIKDEKSFNDIFTNRDPRLGLTIFRLSEEAYKGAYIPFTNQHGNGFPIKKGYMADQWQTNGKETVDKMLIRYAEVLLSYAEALYELNGNINDTQLDQTVNAVRKRSGMTATLTNAFATANNLSILEEIRRERLVEFMDEGIRYDDIIRWKIAEKVLPTAKLGIKLIASETTSDPETLAARITSGGGMFNGQKVCDQDSVYVIEAADTRSFNTSRDYLYPIPSYEIGTSDGNLEQNPNW